MQELHLAPSDIAADCLPVTPPEHLVILCSCKGCACGKHLPQHRQSSQSSHTGFATRDGRRLLCLRTSNCSSESVRPRLAKFAPSSDDLSRVVLRRSVQTRIQVGPRRRHALPDKLGPFFGGCCRGRVTLLVRRVWAQTGVRRAAPQQRSGAGRATRSNPRIAFCTFFCPSGLELRQTGSVEMASISAAPSYLPLATGRTGAANNGKQQILGQAKACDNSPSRGPHRQVHRIPHLGAEPSREIVSTRHGPRK